MPPPLDHLGPLKARAHLLIREPEPQTGGSDYDPSSGVMDPKSFNNTAFFVLFGVLGAAFVIGGIWFFFWAKNGGFHFKEGDWEDYKSTVLRRKVGPNGTIISGVTASTNLGGGSVYKDVEEGQGFEYRSGYVCTEAGDATTVITESTGLSGITAGVSDIGARERRKMLREKKIKQMQAERREKKENKKRQKEEGKKGKRNDDGDDNGAAGAGRRVGENGMVVDEEAEMQAERELRKYRHERPARVGGINKESDGSTWDGSTNPSESMASASLIDNQQSTPTNSPQKGGIRKVYSTADRNAERERERMRAEARRLQERGRALVPPQEEAGLAYGQQSQQQLLQDAEAERERRRRRRQSQSRTPRREFSYQRAIESSVAESAVTRSSRRSERSNAITAASDERSAGPAETERMPGSWAESEIDSELGTKSYHHPIPELRSESSVRPKSGDRRSRGYRRTRQDDFEE